MTNRVRFSLRTCLLLFTIATVVFGFQAVRVNRQRLAVQGLLAQGAVINYGEDWTNQTPTWAVRLSNIVGPDWVFGVETVNLNFRFQGPNITLLRNIPSLQELTTQHSHLSDADMAIIASLRNLKRLGISSAPSISDNGIKHLANHPSLREVGLFGVAISDQSINTLITIPHLTLLATSGSEITDRGVARLSVRKDLEKLRLSGSNVTGASARYLTTMPGLNYIDLEVTQFDDVGLKALANAFPNCTILVTNTRVTESCVKECCQQNPKLEIRNRR
jgi:hypothetical protein